MVKKNKEEHAESNEKHGSFWSQLVTGILIVVVVDYVTGFLIIPDSYTSFRTSHYYYHHGLQAGQDTWGAWGSSVYPVKTNSLGMIDSANNVVRLKSDKQRLLMLGDSHSEGVGIRFAKTFNGLMSKSTRD